MKFKLKLVRLAKFVSSQMNKIPLKKSEWKQSSLCISKIMKSEKKKWEATKQRTHIKVFVNMLQFGKSNS